MIKFLFSKPYLILFWGFSVICRSMSAQDQSGAETYPNIILIMTDDQGWGDVGYNGHPYLQTPHLDQMAREGVEFTRFYAASAVCSPTRASVMTGRHPERFGICTANCGHLKTEEISLAELVKERGYTTGHFGKWHLGTLTRDIVEANRGGREKFDGDYAPPWEHGFDECFVTESKVPTWDPMLTPPATAMDIGKREPGTHFGTYYWTGAGERVENNLDGDDSRIIMDRVIPFISRAAAAERPFLSIVWFHTPHLPVLTGEQYRKPYAGLSEDQQAFYGCITAMDEQVGRLRAHLRELGIADNTLIFFTSDNGPEGKAPDKRHAGQTYGLQGRKRSLMEGGIRVPGLMVWPGEVAGGQVVNTPVHTSDYFPTIAGLLDIGLDRYQRPFDGKDILKITERSGKDLPEERYLPFLFRGQAAYIGTRYKIYRKNATADWQLFDLLDDPTESTDLAGQKPELLEKLKTAWLAWEGSVKNSAEGKDY
jgi:arylsulfatase A-like enzyme